MVKGKFTLPNLKKKHLVILPILFLFTSFPIVDSEPIEIHNQFFDFIKSINPESKVYSVHLYEEISATHNQMLKSDSPSISEQPPSRVFKIHLYDEINASM